MTAHVVVPNCFFGVKFVVDHDRYTRRTRAGCHSLIGNLDLVVGAWAGIRDTRLGRLGRAEHVCASSNCQGAMRMGEER